jgi:hypothetical protein
MRRLLPTTLIALTLVISAMAVAPVAHAETTACPERSGQTSIVQQNDGLCHYFDSNNNEVGAPADPIVTYDNALTPLDSAPANTPTPYKPESTDAVYNTVMAKVMSLFAWLVGVAAITLDNAVYYTVVTMGTYVNNLDAIGVTWRILRDIGNIMLIFGFLAAGIATILNIEMYGWGKKMLPMLLVGAVFINFSLFITEAVIDTGNLFATQFYTQINGGQPAGVKDFDKGSITVSNEGISDKIMGQLGLQTVYGSGKARTEIFDKGNPWIIGFMSILLFIVTAFVMFSLAFVLIARFVVLLFLIILSPIGFAGLAVPKLAKRAGQWWDALFEQTITAPILLLLLYIALAVITDTKFLAGFNSNSNPDWVGFASGNLTGFASVLLSFLVAMGLLLAVVIVSKKMSAFGAGWASSAAGKLTFGATAFGLRSTVGLGSQYLAKAARSSRFGATKLGRVAATTLDRGAKASFDVRGATIAGGLKGIGVDAGKAAEGGYRARMEKSVKGHEEYAKSITGRDQTEKEKAAIAAAVAGQGEAQKARTAAAAEVARLQVEADSNRNMGVLDQKVLDNLRAAQARLQTSETGLAAATAAREKTEAEMTPSSAKDLQKEYAKNIQGKFFGSSFPGWVAFGPGGGEAAKKIKAAKPTKDQLAELLKKMQKEEDEAENKNKPEEKPKDGGGEKKEEGGH